MKKTALIYGLIAGTIVTTFMVYSASQCYYHTDFEDSMIMGYGAILVAFSFIFIGVKNFRDKQNNGVISFGKAFKAGLLITLVASTVYVAAWLVDYHYFMPDFMDKYAAHVLKATAEGGATPEELAAETGKMANYQEMYKNPVFVVLFTYLEIFPMGLIISLLSAWILKRKGAQA